jgi:uncharacterized protein (DUF2141 family)
MQMKGVLVCMLCSISFTMMAQVAVNATIVNFRNDKGLCRACIFNSAEAFEKSQPVKCMAMAPVQKKADIIFTDMPPGNYAIFVFHDANNNAKMDTNFLGIPSEAYGASQNKLPFAAKPKFAANQFTLTSFDKYLTIRLRNL